MGTAVQSLFTSPLSRRADDWPDSAVTHNYLSGQGSSPTPRRFSHGHSDPRRAQERRRTVARSASGRVPHHAPVAPSGRQGDSAQAAEQDLLPDLRSGPRGGALRCRIGAKALVRLVLPVLSRSSALPRARGHPGRDAVRGSGRGQGSRLRRAADAEPLGQPAAQHRLRLLAHRNPVPPCGRQRRGHPSGKAPSHRRRLSRRRGGPRVGGRRNDVRGRVLGVAQHRLQPEPAGRLPDRGQRLRHLRSGRSEHGWRLDLQVGCRIPRTARGRSGRLRSAREPRRDGGRGRRSFTRM